MTKFWVKISVADNESDIVLFSETVLYFCKKQGIYV